jgi:hypothetical protein
MTAIVPTSPVPPGHYGFRQAARMEWIKLRTLRSVKWALLGGALGQVVFAVLGVLVKASEYSSGTIRATLAAVPRWPLVLAAKAAVFARSRCRAPACA